MTRAGDRVAAIREVLKHLDHPERLRSNPLVGWRFSAFADPESAAVLLRHAIETAVDALPSRQRDIVRRCDLHGEANGSVIHDLAITERHFYRERRCALESIAAILGAPKQNAVVLATSEISEDSFALNLSFVEGARQVGDARRGIALLQEISAVGDKPRRAEVACRLAELYCELGSIETACSHLQSAREIAHCAEYADEGLRLQCDSVDATIQWRLGRVDAATRYADRAVDGLRRNVAKEGNPGDARALAVSLLVASEIAVARGKWQFGRRLALEARNSLTITGFQFAAIKARASLAATFAYFFDPPHCNDAAVELQAQYRSAVAAGLTLEAILIRLHLSLVYRFSNAPGKSIKVLEDVQAIAMHVLTPEYYAIVCLELAKSYVLCGEAEKAHRSIEEARRYTLPDGNTSAFIDLLSAAPSLCGGDPERAFEFSTSASAAMARLGIVTSMGEATRIQAEAQHALGNTALATELIHSALAQLTSGGHPFTIAQAHQSARRITGNQKHGHLAAEILANLSAT